MSKRKLKYIAMIGFIIAVTIFIFGNSINDFDKSHGMSDAVSEIILPHECAVNEKVSFIVRKTAHLIEYCALGIIVMLFMKSIDNDYQKKLYGTALFYVLLVAVVDEFIQSFSDRTSSTGDVLLDFFGAIIGFAIVILAHYVGVKIRKRHK